jgi:hypothetical protein
MKRNLAALDEAWARVTSDYIWVPEVGQLAGIGASPDDVDFNRRQRLAREPMPIWSHLVWQAQISVTPTPLSPAEFAQMNELHADLDTFTSRCAELRAELGTPEGKKLSDQFAELMQQKQRGRGASGQYADDIERALREFNTRTSSIWTACNAICDRVLPLKNSSLPNSL